MVLKFNSSYTGSYHQLDSDQQSFLRQQSSFASSSLCSNSLQWSLLYSQSLSPAAAFGTSSAAFSFDGGRMGLELLSSRFLRCCRTGGCCTLVFSLVLRGFYFGPLDLYWIRSLAISPYLAIQSIPSPTQHLASLQPSLGQRSGHNDAIYPLVCLSLFRLWASISKQDCF